MESPDWDWSPSDWPGPDILLVVEEDRVLDWLEVEGLVEVGLKGLTGDESRESSSDRCEGSLDADRDD